jgi:methyl-accepting chemotaxis protein
MTTTQSIKTRVLALLMAVIAVMAAAAGAGFWLCWDSIVMFENEVAARAGERRDVLVLQTEFKKQVQEWKDTLLRGTDAQARERYWGNFNKQQALVGTGAQNLARRLGSGEAGQLLEQFVAAHRSMGEAYAKGYQAYVDNQYDFRAGDVAVKGIDRAPTELLTQAAGMISKSADEIAAVAARRAERAIALSLAVMGAGIVLAVVVFWLQVNARIVRPARGLVEGLGRLAGGDFTRTIPAHSRDELGQVAHSAERLRIDLGRLIADTKQAAHETSQAAAELSVSAAEVAAASERESDAAASTAAAIEELAVSVSVVANNTGEVRETAQESLARSGASRESLRELTVRMGEMRGATDRIAGSVGEFIAKTRAINDMTEQVKGLAAQTNLLALNAAIEAARAGEQGRGFAVVADEVRSLAEKSSRTAEDIARLTQELGAQSQAVEGAVGEGQTALAAGEVRIDELQDGFARGEQLIHRSSDGVKEIAGAAAEQTAASEQIARNMERVAQMAEEAHNAVRQAAQSALRVDQLAARMQENCASFKVAA